MANFQPLQSNDLAGKIGLAEDFEFGALEDGDGAFIVFDMEGESGASARAGEEGVASENIAFSGEESGEESTEF